MLHRYIDNPDFKSRFRILKGGKISLVVSALVVSGSLVSPANAALITINDANTTAQILEADSNSMHITDTGSITVGGAGSLLTLNNGLGSTLYVTNDGTLTKLSTAGVQADGIKTTSWFKGTLTNNGSISVESTNHIAIGINIDTDMRETPTSNANILNTGSITATGNLNASGISVNGTMNNAAVIINRGNITATATNGTSSGIEVSNLVNSYITNDTGGIISVINGSSSYGIRVAVFTGNSVLTNVGLITVNNSLHGAYGISIAEGATYSGNLSNYGTIEVNSGGNNINAYGINSANDMSGGIVNHGTIRTTKNNELDEYGYSIVASTGSGTITNTVSGKLYGNIIVEGAIAFGNDGLISLPYNTTNAVIDNFTHRSAGTLEIGLKTSAGGRIYSKLSTVDAVFQDGSTIAVNVLDSSTDVALSVGAILDNVVSASNSLDIQGTLNITDNSALLNFEYVEDGNTIDLNIVEGATILDSTVAGGGNSNATSAATALQTIQDGNHPEMDELFTALNGLATDAQVAAAVATTTPQTVSASVGAASQISNGIAGIVEQRQQANIGGGLNSGDETFSSKNVWLKTYGSIGEQKNKDGLNGFDVNTYGLGMGIDAEYKHNQNIGIALFYTKADVDVNDVSQTSDMDVFTTLVYGNVPMMDAKTNFLYQLGYALQQTDSSRTLFTNQTATANYTSKTASIDLKLMRDYEINKRFLLQPLVSTTYRHFDNPEYSETGAGANNLDVQAFTSSELLLGVGTLAHYKLDKKSKLIGNVKVDYDTKGDNASVNSSFQGATGVTFGTEGIDNGRWQYEVGVGYERDVQEGHNLNFSYNYQGVGTGFTNHIVSARYMYSF